MPVRAGDQAVLRTESSAVVPEIEWARRADPHAERYSAVTGDLSILALVLPLDLAGHRARFVRDWESGTPKDPVFDYAMPKAASLDDLVDLIRDASAHSDPWHQLLAEEAEGYLRRYRGCASHDAALLTEAMVDENGVPDAILCADARQLLAEAAPADRPVVVDAVATVALFEDVLVAEGITDWTVQLRSNMSAMLSVHAERREVRIRNDVRFSAEHLLRLVAHEIGTHIFRWANARRGARVLELQLAGHTATEEGLAVWHERQVDPGMPLDRRFSLRVLAVSAALTKGFVDVVHELVQYVDAGTAFDITARVKRGLRDTTAPGCFAKDHCYLAGYRAIDQSLNVTDLDYQTLMSCKWPLSRIPLLKSLGLPWEHQRPLQVPDADFVDRVKRRLSAIPC